MNQSQQVERTRNAVAAYAEAIDVPDYDEPAVRRRMSAERVAEGKRITVPRLVGAGVAACAVVGIFVFGSPTVLAQVERMLHAFETIGGQTVPVAVNSVSLDQARHDMPFAVIAPAGIPAGMNEQIDELNPSSSHLDSRLIFRFTEANGGPTLTIMESRALHGAPKQTRLWMTTGTQAPPAAPPLPSAASGEHMYVQFRANGQVTQRIRLEPITLTVRGTRIDIVSPPGLLSAAQLEAIRRAMSG